MHLANESYGWAVGDSGTVLVTTDGGTSWTSQTAHTKADLHAVHFADARCDATPPVGHGWAVGGRGCIMATEDCGNTWHRQASGIDEDLIAVHFTSPQRGLAVGSGGTVIRTADGGEHWSHDDPSRSPAPWYYLSLVAVAALLVPALRRPAPEVVQKRTVADVLMSDKPLELGDPDPLDLNSVALGLSRFLRNRKTTPPLTIAVTGRWGSGKSSLMNLLGADLRRAGFPTVWFNAWHNQKESDLLLSLLETIRRQAAPPLWKPSGVGFRLRLLVRRSWKRWPVVFAILVLFALSLGYFRAHPDRWSSALSGAGAFISGATSNPGAALVDLIKAPGDVVSAVFGLFSSVIEDTIPSAPSNKGVLGLLVSSGGAILLAALKWLRAFGAGVLRSSSKDQGGGNSARRTGARHNFAAEFRDVTEALKPRKLLVLVDDLDRCRPPNVAEILEAINFLVSAGDCYVVMGMERDMVTHCVGLAYADVAEEMENGTAAPAAIGPNAPPKPMPLWVFASQYLEKLINIEVPVPEPAEEQSEEMIAPTREEEEQIERRERAERAVDLVKKSAPWGLAAAVIIGSYFVGYTALQPKPPGPEVTTSVPVAAEPSAPAAEAVPPSNTGVQAMRPEEKKKIVTFIPGRPLRGRVSLIWVTLAGIAITIWGAMRLSIRPETFVKDSDEFERALREWHPLVVAKRNTPRSIKRFVNRVRYYAMAQRTSEPRSGWADRILALLGAGPRPATRAGGAPESVREDLLVALSSLQYVYPDAFGEEGAHDWIRALQTAIAADDRLTQERKNTLTRLMNDSAMELLEARPSFDRIVKGARFAGEPAPTSKRMPGSGADEPLRA